MITPWQMYWLVTLDDIVCFFVVGGVLSLLATAAFVALYGIATVEDDDRVASFARRYLWKFATSAILLLIPGVLIPSTKQMAAIIVIPKIANSGAAQEIGAGAKELAVEWLKELKPRARGEAE